MAEELCPLRRFHSSSKLLSRVNCEALQNGAVSVVEMSSRLWLRWHRLR